MNNSFYQKLTEDLTEIELAGLSKKERVIATPQASKLALADHKEIINLCANNYLGLADDPDLIKCAQAALDTYGYGMASVRFICGTQTVHKVLEKKIADFLGYEDCILYGSCFDANGGLFEALLSSEDAIISDELNHASIIDGVRLCKAKRFRYKNNDMADLEAQLIEATQAGARFKMIATDGVFSMDGIIANLQGICALADRYQAIVMVDDSHATGFVGAHGRGSAEFCKVEGRIDIMTGTLGKALGGASGGYTVAKAEVVRMLRNRSRPYLFSNSLAPVIAATTVAVIDKIMIADNLRTHLRQNQLLFRTEMQKAGFNLIPGEHAIIPIMLYDEKLAVSMAEKLLEQGLYVTAFSYPVVPKGKARIRTQMNASLTEADLWHAIGAFITVGKELKIIA